jgi:hypothetical protein
MYGIRCGIVNWESGATLPRIGLRRNYLEFRNFSCRISSKKGGDEPMRNNPAYCSLSAFLSFFLFLCCACKMFGVSPAGPVITVEELVTNHSKYATQFVDVRGEIVWDFHGPTLCDLNGSFGVFVIPPENINPKPDFELARDSMFQKYERLAMEIGSVQRTLGKAKLFGTLRGKYYLVTGSLHGTVDIYQKPDPLTQPQHRFVLQKVLDLQVQNIYTP